MRALARCSFPSSTTRSQCRVVLSQTNTFGALYYGWCYVHQDVLSTCQRSQASCPCTHGSYGPVRPVSKARVPGPKAGGARWYKDAKAVRTTPIWHAACIHATTCKLTIMGSRTMPIRTCDTHMRLAPLISAQVIAGQRAGQMPHWASEQWADGGNERRYIRSMHD